MKQWHKEPNGDFFTMVWDDNCAICGEYVHESHPHYEDGETVICWDCAFITGRITAEEYVKYIGIPRDSRAEVRDGKIYTVGSSEKFPWEKTDHDARTSPEYEDWRTKVFERDDYRCARCGRRGVRLNAHHKKPFAKFPEDRFDIDNGVTLCEECHREVHKEASSEWIHT